MVESPLKERDGQSNYFTPACLEKIRQATHRWHGLACFSSGSSLYRSLTIRTQAYETTASYQPVQGTATVTLEVKFTINKYNGKLTYQVTDSSVVLTGYYETNKDSFSPGIGGFSSRFYFVADVLSWLSGNSENKWEYPVSAFEGGVWQLASVPGGINNGDPLEIAIMQGDERYGTLNSSTSYSATGIFHTTVGGVPEISQQFDAEITFGDPWSYSDFFTDYVSVKSSMPDFSSVDAGKTSSTTYNHVTRWNPLSSTMPTGSTWYDISTYDLTGWNSGQNAQADPVLSSSQSGAANSLCSRTSLISVNGVNFNVLRYIQCRRYFLDPLAKIVTTNFDASTSCSTVSTPVVLSDGAVGAEFDIETTVPAVQKQKELTIGAICP